MIAQRRMNPAWLARQTALSFGLFVVMFAAALLLQTSKASAAYNGARLIDDAVFRESNSMSRSVIQGFLESKNSGLKSKTFTFNCASAGAQAEALYEAAGAPCGATARASDIIYYAARIYGINPRVILATLQKEQSLITTTNPTSWQINQAMGYGCPDSGGCGSSNFFYQIDNGTWVLRFHYERARGNNAYWFEGDGWVCGTAKQYYKPSLYPNVGTTFYDDNNVAFRKYTLANPATSAMYCYTPHTYNNPQGLYGLPKYGTKGMYYSGSYNFVRFYEAWFGSTISPYKDQTIVGDWDGNGTKTLGLKRGNLYLLDNNNDGAEDASFGYGRTTDQVIVGDWDGDGRDEIGLKRGNEFYLDNNNNGNTDVYFAYGRASDQVITGDWNGDGKVETGLKRGNEYFLNSNNTSKPTVYAKWGRTTDQVIVGDWDGNGTKTLGLKRGSEFFLDHDNNGSANTYFSWGRSTDRAILGDWNGDGITNVGLKRGNEHFLDSNNDGRTNTYVVWGRDTDRTMTADWDGDNTDEIGLKRYSNQYYLDFDNNASANATIIFGYY